MLVWIAAHIGETMAALTAAASLAVALFKWIKGRAEAEKERDMRCEEHKRKLEEVYVKTNELEKQLEELREEVATDRVVNAKTAAQISTITEQNAEIRDDIRAIFKILTERK